MRLSKRVKQIRDFVDSARLYELGAALDILKACPSIKFDQTVEVALKTGVDTHKPEQQVRGVVILPHGTGRTKRIWVIATGDKAAEALQAGADRAGGEELLAIIKSEIIEFDVLVATPDMMREVGKHGKFLGPRGLMPSPKDGTVTAEIARAVSEIKRGKVSFKTDKQGVVGTGVGKLSFSAEQLKENIEAWVDSIDKSKPSTVKGNYMQSLVLSSTMGPGLKIDLRSVGSR